MRYYGLAVALVLLGGGLFVLAGVLRLGFISQFLSRPVMDGFIFGLALFVAVKQLPKLFGIERETATRSRNSGSSCAISAT